ncbi:Ubiquitin carboxyl-terminal hydrolase 46 [Tritrichomonas musculus]|uniref:Ubiquitin carboxyl-terminal hydrolase 46 n=1 Tax=Tritrichomonas musculus TaxID=1915356 RepID=A0ABR2KTJ2_9EUKA
MTESEPTPVGIPNRIGNTCWFQSATQCIFRNPEFRKKIISFDSSKLQIKNDQSSIDCLKELQRHFETLLKPGNEVDNRKLVTKLKANNRLIFVEQESSGKDSFYAVDAYFELFATLLGNYRPDFHSLNSPLGSLQMMKIYQQTPNSPEEVMNFIYCILTDPGDNKTSFLHHLDKLFYLPDVLLLRQDKNFIERIHPEPFLTLPEPFDYIAADKDLSKCKTEVKYELFGLVCYQGANADHAVALIKLAKQKDWYLFNDQNVEKKGDDSILRNDTFLTPSFFWPALFFYRKQK